LVAEEYHPVFVEGLSNVGNGFGIQRVRQINAQKLGAERARRWLHFKSRVLHGGGPS
jgi:hypothetical protein